MNCQDVDDRLIELLYDEVPHAERGEFHQHLEACPTCLQKWNELRASVRLLDRLGDGENSEVAQVDLRAVYGRGVRMAGRRARRWKTIGLIATAASLLVATAAVFGLRFELRPNHVVIGWSDAAEKPPAAEALSVDTVLAGRFDELEARLAVLIEESKRGRHDQQEVIHHLAQALADVRERNDARWKTVGIIWRKNQGELASVRQGMQGLVHLVHSQTSSLKEVEP